MAAVALAVTAAACDAPTVIAPLDAPLLLDAQARSAPDNVLSARVIFRANAGDDVRAAFWVDPALVSRSPSIIATGGVDTIIVLGLRPTTTYEVRIEANGGAEPSVATIGIVTHELPEALRNAEIASLSGTTSHYSLTAISTPSSGQYAVAFDASGRLAWYHDFTFAGKRVSAVMKQPNGNFTAFLGMTSGWIPDDGYYAEVTPEGRLAAVHTAPVGYYMDNHELLITGSGAQRKAHFFTFSIRELDLTHIGGVQSVQLAGHQLVRTNAIGQVELMWDSWDHITVDEWQGDEAFKAGAKADYDHPNSLAFDNDGNYVVSWRNLDQVMAISQAGEVLWRLGGARGDLAFVNDPFGRFSKQHSAKVLPSGNVLVYDNGSDHSPAETRAVEYQLDLGAKTATMVWQFRHTDAIYTPFVGWTERLSNHRTWVAFAGVGRIVEVGDNGQVTWEGQLRINGEDGWNYRIVAISSLY